MQRAFKHEVWRRLQRRLRDFAGPAVLQPELPLVQSPGRDSPESRRTFDKRIKRARAKRTRQIAAIEKQYRAAVKARNAKVREFTKNLKEERLGIYAMAAQEVYGRPLLEAMAAGANREDSPEYDLEGKRMHISFRHQYAEQGQDWLFAVPKGDSAQKLYQALREGSVTASAHYLLKGDRLVLNAVYAHHEGVRFPGVPANAKTLVVALDEQDALADPGQQAPELKDRRFEEYLARERQAFDANAR